jgi:hypothetical protein
MLQLPAVTATTVTAYVLVTASPRYVNHTMIIMICHDGSDMHGVMWI